MPRKLTATWPLLLLLILVLTQINADVSHLSKNYLPSESEQRAEKPLADEVAPAEHMQANAGAFYSMAGLMLPSGYSIPTGSNVLPVARSPPNFPLPIYPPFFGFGAGQSYPNQAQFPGGPFPAGGQGGQFPVGQQGVPYPVGQQAGQFSGGPPGGGFSAGPQGLPYPVGAQAGQFSGGAQGGPFPGGPQGSAFPAGPQGGPFPAGPQGNQFPAGPQGSPFPGGPQGGPFPAGPQGGPFPAGPQGIPFPPGPQSGNFPVGPQGSPFPGGPQGGQFAQQGGPPPGIPQSQNGPFPFQPDYLTTQGLPSPGSQLPFQQNVGFGMPPPFAGPQPTNPYQQLVNVGQPFSPSFGIPGQHYQPQQFADEPQQEINSNPKNIQSPSTTVAPKSHNRDTIYASNGGYVYKRAK